MTTYKSIYKDKLIDNLKIKKLEYTDEIINSILSKVAIHSKNKYGKISFEDELFECDVDNGLFFYDEFNKKETFNRKNRCQ